METLIGMMYSADNNKIEVSLGMNKLVFIDINSDEACIELTNEQAKNLVYLLEKAIKA